MRAYCERHKGLEELFFFCYMWARRSDLLADEPQRTPAARRQLRLQPGGIPAYSCAKIALTFIQFGLDCFDNVRTPNKPFLEETKFVGLDDGGSEVFSDPNKIHEFLDNLESDYNKDPKKIEEPLINSRLVNEVNLLEQHGGLGCKFLQFLRFCSSLDFAQMKRQSFVDFCLYSSFCAQQHVRLHKAAESSYYKLCFTDDFSTLPYSKSKQAHVMPPDTSDINLRPAIDGESFVFELPAEGRGRLIQNNKRIVQITKKTGVDDVFIRSLPFRVSSDMTCQFVVTVAGSVESVNTLRRILAPTGYINCPMNEVMLSNALASQVFHRLLQICPADDEESKALSKRAPRRR
ncbi:hypothetical protein M3Y97_00994400 [Aphelenchoides bicaudatus]|nr:hypothetical protein M3Y97_00994400 [Aphelenchoides bicaudatus]